MPFFYFFSNATFSNLSQTTVVRNIFPYSRLWSTFISTIKFSPPWLSGIFERIWCPKTLVWKPGNWQNYFISPEQHQVFGASRSLITNPLVQFLPRSCNQQENHLPHPSIILLTKIQFFLLFIIRLKLIKRLWAPLPTNPARRPYTTRLLGVCGIHL